MKIKKTRTAITGLGVVCAIGNDRQEAWRNTLAGVCGIRDIEFLDTLWMGVRVAGEVRDFEPVKFMPPDEAERMVRSGHFAIAAAHEALEQSGLDLRAFEPSRIGLVMGTCQGSLAELNPLNPRVVDSVHASCDFLAHHLSLSGPRLMVSTACSAGANSIGVGRDKLWSGEADVVLVGGTDALTFFSLSGFAIMGSLSEGPCSPYSRSDGLSLGEGAAVMILEPWDRAVERGAPIMAELLGYGTSADAYHASAPDPSGRGAALAMRRALDQSRLSADAVDYVNGHGTATTANDGMERKAMQTIFGERATRVPCSSTKSQIGHTLGAAGTIEAGVCVLATQHDVLPPTVSFDETIPTEFDFVPNRSRRERVDVAISNNYAFGGSNAAVVVSKPSAQVPEYPETDADVVVTGVAAVGPLGVGAEAWFEGMAEGRSGLGPVRSFDASKYGNLLGGEVPRLDARGFAPSGVWRKMDSLGRHAVAASRLAWRDADLDLSPSQMENVGVIFGTNCGSIEQTEAFDRGARAGHSQANPILFPNAVLNSAAGHVCVVLGLRGPTQTFTSGGVSGLAALAQAADLVRQGEIDVALVLGGDILYETTFAAAMSLPGFVTNEAVRPFDERASGTALSGSFVTVVVESARHAAARGVAPIAEVLATGMASDAFDFADAATAGPAWGAAMALAIDRSGLSPGDIGYVAAAAPGIRVVDELEAGAVSKVIGSSTPVSAPKSMTGETLGAAGLVGVLAAILAFRRGRLAPTINLDQPLPDVSLEHVREAGVDADVDYCLVNSIGIGGNYASTVLGRPRTEA